MTAAAALLAIALPARAEVPAAEALPPGGWQPFLQTSQSLIQKFTLDYLHQPPLLPEAGSVTVDTALQWMNLWAYSEQRFLIDGEMWAVDAVAELGLSRRLAAGFRLRGMYLDNGFADGPINHYHNVVLLDDLGRNEFPRNRLRVASARHPGDAPRELLGESDVGWMSRAPVLSVRMSLNDPASRTPVTLKAAVDLPQYEQQLALVQRGGRDWALGLSTAAPLDARTHVTAGLAWVRTRNMDVGLDGRFRRSQASALLGIDYSYSARLGLVAQALAESPLAEGTKTVLDRYNFGGMAGIKWRAAPRLVLAFAAWEDLSRHNNTADVGLHFGLRTEWP